jgi:O-acetyl-ADP-ribose deacetylase (regulator of RNase III)
MKYNEIYGNLIELALQGEFDVIAHGANCWCTMGAGLAPQMAKTFGCDTFPMERLTYENEYGDKIPTNNKGDINKLGQIDYETKYLWFKHPMLKDGQASIAMNHMTVGQSDVKKLIVVNAYSQFHYGKNHKDGADKPIDYHALRLCLRKMNYKFKGMHIGLPTIGCGLAGGNFDYVRLMIQEEFIDCNVTVVIYDK